MKDLKQMKKMLKKQNEFAKIQIEKQKKENERFNNILEQHGLSKNAKLLVE